MRNDIERVFLTRRSQRHAMVRDIDRDFPGGPLVVVILLKGALVFAADLLRRMERVLEIECLNVASDHGGTTRSGKVDFPAPHFSEVNGRHVLLDDNLLNGRSPLPAIQRRLIAEAAAVHNTVLLADKHRPRASTATTKDA